MLRNIVVPEDRSIIAAIGPAEITQSYGHVNVAIKHTGFYAHFFINKVLGRLECASEPRLRYFKAYCHAVTTHVQPDPLTGRTGTEEALHCLRAGNAQPWIPVDAESYRILGDIARLTPRRVYYPTSLKVLQNVTWDDALASAAQHEGFEPLVKHIIHQCTNLLKFHHGLPDPPPGVEGSDEYLASRSHALNQRHCTTNYDTACEIKDHMYVA